MHSTIHKCMNAIIVVLIVRMHVESTHKTECIVEFIVKYIVKLIMDKSRL